MKKFLLLVLLLAAIGVELLHGQTTMNEFIGVNIRAKDAYPQGFGKFGILREYHEWASDIGYDDDNIINCPQRKLKLNPAANDPSTLLNFDGFYSAYAGQAYPTLKGLAPEMRGLQSYGGGVVLEQKPFCQGLEGLVGYGDGSGSFSLGALNQSAGTFAPTVNGFYDGIVSATVSPGESYAGSVTIQLPNDGTNLLYGGKEYFLRIWVDFNENGEFKNKYIELDTDEFPTLGKGESVSVTGAENYSFLDESGAEATDNFLKLNENNFTQYNNFTKTIDYDFKIPPGINPGLIKMRVAFTAASPESYDPATGLPKFWQLPTPTGYGSSAMWDVGLVDCGNGSSFTVPSWNESYYGEYNDIFGKITNLTLKKGSSVLIDKTIAYQDANGKHQNFFDVSSVIYFDKDYEIQVGSNLNTAYFGMWLMDKSGAFAPIVSPSQISGSPFSFSISSMNNPNFPAGMYRARMVIGDANISPNGNFAGEIRDYLVVLGNDPACNGMTSLGNIPPTSPVTSGAIFKDLKLILKAAQDAPETWLESAKWASMITAKYGNNDLYTGGSNDLKSAFATLFDASELPQSANDKRFGLGLIDYVEIGNEMDKFWRGDKSLLNSGDNLYQMIPSQFEAYLSANYDGACKEPMFEIGNSGEYYGVKNMDDNIDVAMGGMAGMQGGFLEKVIDFAVANRPSSSCSRVLPFDIINLHHYCTTLNVIDEMSPIDDPNDPNNPPQKLTNFEATYQIWDWNGFGEGHGVSPEAGGLRAYTEQTLEKLMAHAASKGVLEEFVNCDVWISEFGYDSSLGDLDPKTITSWVAVPVVGDNSLQETQAQWNVRSFLELSAVKAESNNQTMEVNRAMIFDYRDDWNHPANPTYNESGLRRDGEVHNSAPKKSWFHVQTLRNVLGGTEYQGEFTGKTMTLLSGAFDFSSEARIYHYQGDYKGQNADILVIWSPNSSDSEGELTLDFLSASIKNTLLSSNASGVDAITIITPRDGDEDGKHVPITDIANSTYTFTGDHAITETPMYVVLNVAEEETEHSNCPNFVIEDQGCSSFTLRWDPMDDEPKRVDIYVVNANSAKTVVDAQGNDRAVLQIENEAYKLQARDYKYDIRKHGIGHLKAGESYYVVFLMKWADGSIHECSSELITMPEDGLCQIPYWDGSGTAPAGLHFTASVGSGADDGLDAFTYLGMDCANYEEAVVPDCNVGDNDDDGMDDCHDAVWDADKMKYINDEDQDGIQNGHDADDDGIPGTDPGKIDDDGNGIDDRYERANNKIWEWPGDGVNNPQMIVEFSSGVILNSLSFLHTTGNGYITVEYELCGCPATEEFGTPGPDKGWYHDVTIAPNGYMNWVYLSEGFPANSAISRIRLTRYQGAQMSLARLSFCGEARACPTVYEPPGDHIPSKGFRRVGITTSEDGTSAKFRMAPIANLPNDPSAGYKPVYHMLYQEDNGQELDFTSAKYQKAILYDGSEEVTATIKDLLPEKQYKVYLYLWNPCNWRWGSRYPIIPNLEGGPTIPLVGVLDTIIYFNTYSPGVEVGDKHAISTAQPHFVSASPNPTTGWTTFNWDLTGYSQLLIYSSNTGELVASYQVDPTGVSHLADLTGLGNGSYYIRLEGDNLSPLSGQFVKTTE